MALKHIAPVRMKRRRVHAGRAEAESAEPAEPAESVPERAKAAEAAESAPTAPLAPTGSTRGILRKSAVRRWVRQEAPHPVKIREAFFTALEAKVTADLARSLARAREQKRGTLMSSDA
jgi:hypothetical protein